MGEAVRGKNAANGNQILGPATETTTQSCCRWTWKFGNRGSCCFLIDREARSVWLWWHPAAPQNQPASLICGLIDTVRRAVGWCLLFVCFLKFSEWRADVGSIDIVQDCPGMRQETLTYVHKLFHRHRKLLFGPPPALPHTNNPAQPHRPDVNWHVSLSFLIPLWRLEKAKKIESISSLSSALDVSTSRRGGGRSNTNRFYLPNGFLPFSRYYCSPHATLLDLHSSLSGCMH